ncbi:MAG: DUF559 domain-containing protein [Bacteroidetes bacterium]|nr:MAG: DUF559 domain-containing protein [Bacteroidota bacterium]
MTPSEVLLWKNLKGKKLDGYKFLRQHPIFYQRNFTDLRFFVADFYCAEAKLVIELDGKIHDFQKQYDVWREEILKSKNLNVIQIKNDELKDQDSVIKKIKTALKSK